MKRTIYALCVLTVMAAGNICSQDIPSLIQAGKIEEARDELQAALVGNERNGNLLYFLALLEPNTDSASALFEAAIANGADDRSTQESYLRLTQIALLNKRADQMTRWSSDYLRLYPSGVFVTEMLRIQILVVEVTGETSRALELVDKQLKMKLGKRSIQQLTIDKARLLTSLGKPVGANSMLTKITKEADGEVVPQALGMLASAYLKNGKAEEAGRYYALLFEEYPLAIGLGSLEDQISSAPVSAVESVQAEQVTSTFYSVKVGVFSSIENARAQATVFAGNNWPIDVVKRTIQGKPYHMVYVGKFQDYDSAAKLRASLEQKTGEKYEVTAR